MSFFSQLFPRHRAITASVCLSLAAAAIFVPLHGKFAQAQTRTAAKAAIAEKSARHYTVISAPNPHFRATRSRKVDTIVLHYMSGINVNAKRWDDPKLSQQILKRYRVSAHYIIDRKGQIYKLVQERHVAYHAGGSIMPAPDNRRNANSFSIGIEMIATHTSGFTDAQYDAVAHLVKGIKSRHPIRHIVGHNQIAGTRAVSLGLRKDRKPDPGPKFDWGRFKQMIR